MGRRGRRVSMAQKDTPTPGDCVTITKERYQELLDYERVALWALNSIVVASLPDIESEKLKECYIGPSGPGKEIADGRNFHMVCI